MLNLFIKAEIFVDKTLIQIGMIIIKLFKLIIPNNWRNAFFSIENKIENYIQNKKDKIRKRSSEIIVSAKKEVSEGITKVKTYDFKAKINFFIVELKSKIKSLTPKEFIIFVLAQFTIPLLFLKKWFASLSPNKILIGVSFFTIFGLVTLNVAYKGSKVISSSNNLREPASIEAGEEELEVSGLPPRPIYHKQEQRQMELTHVKVPVYYNDINELHTLDIDFSIQTSNRFTAKYIDKFEHEVRDHLLSTVEPIVPEFPMEAEGREIIKEKIQIEINEYLRSKDVEGEVQDVQINYILGT